jgi:glucose/mannose-6-phosphate isomerase
MRSKVREASSSLRCGDPSDVVVGSNRQTGSGLSESSFASTGSEVRIHRQSNHGVEMSLEARNMQPRIARLAPFLGSPLFESTLWGHEYTLEGLNPDLRRRIEDGTFKRIVFYGMGCSSVVSDIVKGFFLTHEVPITVDVVNDYDTDWFISKNVLKDPATLIFIVCYSGWSVEPCLFYDRMKALTGNKNLIVLTGGGKIQKLAQEDGGSVIQYKLRHADREYPLYHVQQFFSIFLDLFHKLGITKTAYESELKEAVSYLHTTFDSAYIEKARAIASKLSGSRIAFLATAKWYVQLLKQTTMFFNEIAMVPSHRNLLHEFSHTEVAAYSNPSEKQAIVVFLDSEDDEYTKSKVATLHKLFGDKSIPQNKNIEIVQIDIDQDGFFKKFYTTHFFMVYVAFFLGVQSDVEGRDLISIAAKNPWWSAESISAHPRCVDIPGQLSDDIQKSIELV